WRASTRCYGWPRRGRSPRRTTEGDVFRPVRAGRNPSGPQHAGDGLGRFLDLRVDLVAALDGRVRAAVAQMLLQQLQRERLQGLGGGGHLGEYVDAVDVLVHHPLQSADLALDTAQAFEVFLLLLVIAV